MNSRRYRWVWLAYGLCVALAAAAMLGVDRVSRRLERAESQTRSFVAKEESLQVALWRMDSTLAALVAEEGMRPYDHYRPFTPDGRASDRPRRENDPGELLTPSPLLRYESPRIRLHFEFDPDGRLSSPQVPVKANAASRPSPGLIPNGRDELSRRLDEFRKVVRRDEITAALEEKVSVFCCPTETKCCPTDEPVVMAEAVSPLVQKWESGTRGLNDYQKRSSVTRNAQSQSTPWDGSTASRPGKITQGRVRAVWMGPVLLLARRVRIDDQLYVQGCWLDWDVLCGELLGGVADLLKNAELRPVREPGQASPTHCLAAIPAELVGEAASLPESSGRSPVQLSLAIAWSGLALASGAVALLLGGVLALSERRGQFVSAVTHELRTPLTTFRLYTEMLAEGMVSDESARNSYVQTLRSEADRLGHLVENVLAFARVERGRATGVREDVSLGDLLGRLTPSLSEQARRAGMVLVVEGDAGVSRVRTDPSVVGQVLGNLVDNACKYGGAGDDRRIRLEHSADPTHLRLVVRDHGPGVTGREARRLFRPFSKSAGDAARSAPGVGLGLAISRRLARALGGDLRLLRDGSAGACFLLSLPRLVDESG